MTDPLHETLVATVERHALWRDGATVVVAVSGGQDSSALLHSLNILRDHWSLRLHAAHFNHQLRGEEAEGDAHAVEQMAAAWSIPCTVGCGDVASAARRMHRSKQEAARDLRQRFLQGVAAEVGAQCIATGHTSDDRVETVLLNVIRGTGVDGLQGIAAVSGNRVRPLIDVSRAETDAYCRRHGIQFRTDPSNVSPVYTRNRVREELLPLLAGAYNPGIRRSLARLSTLASDDAAFLSEQALIRFQRAVVNNREGRVVLSTVALRGEPPSMQRRLVRMAILQVRGGLHDVDFQTTERVVGGVARCLDQTRFQLTLPPGDIKVTIDGSQLAFERAQPRASALRVERGVLVPGVTRIEPWGLELVAEVASPDEPGATDYSTALINYNTVAGRLIVRSRLPGDALQPLGMVGTRKLQDILTDRKVPREQRDRIPIVADEIGILWVAGHALSERARIGAGTVQALHLKMRSFDASIRPLTT